MTIPKLYLAPMEGVLDHFVREILTELNEYELCVTEFLRVTDTLLPKKAFMRLCPELVNGGKTQSGTPVRIQLLGQSPEFLAENANRALLLGSNGIDLNCGCPSKCVNGHGGGAVLLKNPELIYKAVYAISQAIKNLPNNEFSVKIRLGWDSSTPTLEIVDAIQSGGAQVIFVHGRTKEDGYQSDKIKWDKIGEIKHYTQLKIVANGEIWDLDSAKECLKRTGCDDLMIGRGALALPNITHVIKGKADIMSWSKILKMLLDYFNFIKQDDKKGDYHMARIKQWLRYLSYQYAEAKILYSKVRPLKKSEEVRLLLRSEYYSFLH